MTMVAELEKLEQKETPVTLNVLVILGGAEYVWNPKDPAEVAEVRAFWDHAKSQGRVAYALAEEGGSAGATVLHNFDPDAMSKVLMVPAVVGG